MKTGLSMDILGEWLSTTIQRDLGQVLNHVDGVSDDDSRPSCEDDGNNLRVSVSNKGVVQLIKVCPFSESCLAFTSQFLSNEVLCPNKY